MVSASTPNDASRAFQNQWGSKLETFVSAQPFPRLSAPTDAVDVEKGENNARAVDSASQSSSSSSMPPEKGIMKTVELQVMIQRRTHDMVGDVGDGPVFM